MALRVVPDTGVFAVAITRRGAGSLLIIEAWLRGELTFITSEAVLVELCDVLRDVFNLLPEKIEYWEQQIRNLAVVVTPTETISDCRDPGDNKVLEAAIAGNADCVVTFDDDLWKMSPYRGVQILKVRPFLRKTGLTPRRRRK